MAKAPASTHKRRKSFLIFAVGILYFSFSSRCSTAALEGTLKVSSVVTRCVVYSRGPFPCLCLMSGKRKTKMRKRYLNFLCVIIFCFFFFVFHELNTKDGSVKSREIQMVNHRARPTCTIPVLNQIYINALLCYRSGMNRLDMFIFFLPVYSYCTPVRMRWMFCFFHFKFRFNLVRLFDILAAQKIVRLMQRNSPCGYLCSNARII